MTDQALPRSPAPSPSRKWQAAGIAAAAGVTGLVAAMYLPPQMAGAAALSVLCIGLWATAIVPEYWTAIGFFTIAMISGIAPAQTVFSGFSSSTFWLLFSGLIMGAAIRHTGLGQRAAVLLSGMLGRRYVTVISGIVAFGLALAFVMPSAMGRVVLLAPIVMALADHMGYGEGSKGRTGMLIAAAFGTFAPAFTILPSNIPNMMLAGMAENLYGMQLSYGSYLLLHFPVLGALKAAIVVPVVLWMFPDRDPVHEAAAPGRTAPLTGEQRRLAAVLALCLALWLTDSLHHISPAWIGLAAALYCLWPHSKLTSPKCLNEEINYGSLFFVAGIMGLGAVISASGLGEAVVQGLSRNAAFAADRPLWDIAALTGISTLIGTVTNLPGVPTIMTPIARDLAQLTGLPLATVLMTQVLAFSNVLLPHQAPPLVAAMQAARLPAGPVVRMCLVLFVITLTVLIPLDLVWWHVLGMF